MTDVWGFFLYLNLYLLFIHSFVRRILQCFSHTTRHGTQQHLRNTSATPPHHRRTTAATPPHDVILYRSRWFVRCSRQCAEYVTSDAAALRCIERAISNHRAAACAERRPERERCAPVHAVAAGRTLRAHVGGASVSLVQGRHHCRRCVGQDSVTGCSRATRPRYMKTTTPPAF